MTTTLRLRRPARCTAAELREFEHLVRRGFDGSDATLPARIGDAERLAFYRDHDVLVAIAGLKAPGERARRAVFDRAGIPAEEASYELELGWVFVVPELRGRRIGAVLCRRLLAQAADAPVFATTRPTNAPMIGILRALGFARAGRPYPRPERNEVLTLFLRPGPEPAAREAAG